MPNQALKQCKHIGCFGLVQSGYCNKHKHIPQETEKAKWKRTGQKLDRRKTPEDIAFYHSPKWIKTSKAHREMEPLCRRCKAGGKVVPAQLVHHRPDRRELERQGLSPFDHQYLESLCIRCHNEELRKKIGKNNTYYDIITVISSK